MLTLIKAAILERGTQPPQLCIICQHQSRNHPTGGLHRYTRRRINGHPICHRHRTINVDRRRPT